MAQIDTKDRRISAMLCVPYTDALLAPSDAPEACLTVSFYLMGWKTGSALAWKKWAVIKAARGPNWRRSKVVLREMQIKSYLTKCANKKMFQFFRSSRRVKMSFLYEKGRAATFLLLCAYRFKKGNASLDFEQDDFVNKKQRQLPFPISSPGRQQVRNFRDFACCPKVLT